MNRKGKNDMNNTIQEIIELLDQMGKSVDEKLDILEYMASDEYLMDQLEKPHRIHRNNRIITGLILIICIVVLVYKYCF